MNRMTHSDRWLAWLIRANAAMLVVAVVPVFFPTELMAEMHERFGLGPFPRDRLTEYLTRSAAACYALHGGLLILLSTDVCRYRPLIPWVYYLHLGFAGFLLGIDLFAGMPGWWIASEVGTISTVAIILLIVERIARNAAQVPPVLPFEGQQDTSAETQR